MANHTKNKPSTKDRYANLVAKLEESGQLAIEEAKVEMAERIYLAMGDAGISQAEFANRLGVSRSYITQLLDGEANFTIETLVKIGIALGRKLILPDYIRAQAQERAQYKEEEIEEIEELEWTVPVTRDALYNQTPPKTQFVPGIDLRLDTVRLDTDRVKDNEQLPSAA